MLFDGQMHSNSVERPKLPPPALLPYPISIVRQPALIPPTSVLAHQRREKPRCWSKIFFNEIYLLIHIYIYILRVSISYEFLINPSFRGHRFEDRFEFLAPPFFRYVVVSRIASRERKTNGDIKEPIDRQSSNSGTKESAADKGERRW